MKKLMLSLSAVVAMASFAMAGETYTKESKTSVAPPPCPQWYADNEFNLTLSGAYAFTGTEWRDDRYLGVDHAWGGTLDAKYFVHRYFGFGFQGGLLFANTDDTFNNNNDDSNVVGTALGTFTLRFPISCSRFAPYVWGGGGGIWGGGNSNGLNNAIRTDRDDSDGRWLGQAGGGFEVRITPHCGWTNDFSWNIVEGSKNNFGMARTGINFAF
jgi:hypothetical protein